MCTGIGGPNGTTESKRAGATMKNGKLLLDDMRFRDKLAGGS
jgi:hypothetical protein